MYYRGPEGGIWGVSRPFDGMVNATGAGDASMAGIIYATRQGYAADEILAFGMGAGMVAHRVKRHHQPGDVSRCD